jgi:hypothetical protein
MTEQPSTTETTSTDIQAPKNVSKHERRLELFATLILAITTVATAWSGFQANLWSGEQSALYAQAGTKRTESVKADSEALSMQLADLNLFTNWLDAFANEQTELSEFYIERFRPEFMLAFEAWIAETPRTNPDAPPSPFAMPEYQLEAAARSDALEAEADRLFQEGQDANDIGDAFVLNTVILAVALFFTAMSERFDWQTVRYINLAIAIVITIFGFFRIFGLPNLPPPM